MKISAPGKLMLSGEWSVLENNIPCIVLAIDQKVFVEIKESQKIFLEAKGSNHKTNAKFENGELIIEKNEEKEFFLFVAKSIEATLKYLQEKKVKIKLFSIKTNSSDTIVKLNNSKIAKVGFGSSAAIVSATIAAVLAFHGEDISLTKTKEKIFKLGCIAHYLAQGKVGSSFDVAASTYGGAIIYQKPDMGWLVRELEKNISIKQILEKKWPYFKAESINIPKHFRLSVGFVGYSASTRDLILNINKAKEKNKEEYEKLIFEIKYITEKLIDSIKQNNEKEIIYCLKENRLILKKFSKWSNNNLETADLKKLADIAEQEGGAGKFSGAGGGDCGIAVSFDAKIKKSIEEKWSVNKIYLINTKIYEKGVNLEC